MKCSGSADKKKKKAEGKRRQHETVKFLIQYSVSIGTLPVPRLQWLEWGFDRMGNPVSTPRRLTFKPGVETIAAFYGGILFLHLCTIWPILVSNLPNFKHYTFRPYSPTNQFKAQSRPWTQSRSRCIRTKPEAGHPGRHHQMCNARSA